MLSSGAKDMKIKSTTKLLDKAVNALETYNQECDATKGDVVPMMGHNSRNREKTK